MANMEKIADKLAILPALPGCYLMKNVRGDIIYVGKAKVLKNRVRQYFVGAHDLKTTRLVANIDDFEYIVTGSEKEALLLEINLIKKHTPPFNIMFMDDKTYPYLKLTREKAPRLEVVRNTKDKKATYFGPYPDSGAAYDTMKLVNRMYPEASEKTPFARAHEIHQIILSIQHITDRQQIAFSDHLDRDVFGYYVDKGYISIQGFFMRGGKLLERTLSVTPLYEEEMDAFISFIVQYYEHNPLPNEILLPKTYDVGALVEL